MDLHLRESLEHHLSILACPACQADLVLEDEGLRCGACRAVYGTAGNIPWLFCPNDRDRSRDVTMTVKPFYEETPFPNYDQFDNVGWHVEKARKGSSPSSRTTRSLPAREPWKGTFSPGGEPHRVRQ